MSRRFITIAITLAAMSIAACAVAAPKARKPAPKPVKKPAPRVVLGTKQFSGDQAVLGQEYTLGKAWPMNFKLNSVEYSTDRLRVGDRATLPTADEKYLVLRYTLHNPQSREQLVRSDSFHFTAVDSTDTNREGRGGVGVEATQQDLSVRLKPGQKLDAYTFIVVPAKGVVPKLIVKPNDDMVLRYDLKGKIKPLTGPTLDPTANDGATALSEVPAEIGKTYQMGVFDITVDGMTYSSTPLKDKKLAAGERNFIISATVKNAHPLQQLLRYDTLRLKLTDQDRADIRFRQQQLAASRDTDFSSQIAPGKEVKVRYPVQAAKDQQVTSVSISQGNSPRTFVFDASAVK